MESLKQKGKLSETKQEELEQQYFSVKEEVRRLRELKEEDAKKFQDRITSLELQISRVQSELTSAQVKLIKFLEVTLSNFKLSSHIPTNFPANVLGY